MYIFIYMICIYIYRCFYTLSLYIYIYLFVTFIETLDKLLKMWDALLVTSSVVIDSFPEARRGASPVRTWGVAEKAWDAEKRKNPLFFGRWFGWKLKKQKQLARCKGERFAKSWSKRRCCLCRHNCCFVAWQSTRLIFQVGLLSLLTNKYVSQSCQEVHAIYVEHSDLCNL